jgi:hypothetical protein
MKIDIKDDHVMGLSMAASGAYGIHWLGFPAKAQVQWLHSAGRSNNSSILRKSSQPRRVAARIVPA